MAQDPDLNPPPLDTGSAEAGKPDRTEVQDAVGEEIDPYAPGAIDKSYWIGCMEDAERAERDWRSRGREIIEIYRNETRNGRTGKMKPGPVTFNILFANTEVMLPAIYQKQAQPVVRSRFTKITEPMMPPPAMMGPPGVPPMPPPMGAPPGALGPGMPPPPMGAPPGASPIGGGAPPPMAGPPGPNPVPTAMPGEPPPLPPPGMPPLPGMPPADPMASASPMAMGAGMGMPPPPPIDLGPPPPPQAPGMLPGMPAPPMPGLPQAAPGRPPQQVIETAASIMEKALEIVMDDDQSTEAIKLAIKDVLLPGRGVCRVRWRPQMEKKPVTAGDGMTPLPPTMGAEPLMEDVKVWEEVGDEYVFWEDLLLDPVRTANDMDWIAFRHLFTKEALEAEFAGSEQYDDLVARGRVGDILKWTDESAAKSPVGGGSAMKTAEKLGDHRKKAMVWEIWDRVGQRIIWFIREVSGLVLRVDEDSYRLDCFYPVPAPMLSIRTTDSRIPRPFYDLYSNLASDLDDTSVRISNLTKQIKARGAYNAASKEVAQLLTAGDQKMVPVEGVDLISGGLQNHIWMLPIDIYVVALEKLYLAREQIKQAIYEIMGISDIMRGATKASETATAQRIKGSMGLGRLEDQKQQAGNFIRDLMRIKADLIAKNFDAATLEAMTGEKVTPEVEAVLRSDFMRTCSIDIEADSTVEVDLQAEQQAMTQVLGSIQAVMQGAMAMLQSGILPPAQVVQLSLELLKMVLHPVRYSRGVVELINDFQEQLQAQIAMQAMMPPAPMPMGPVPPGGAGGLPGVPKAGGPPGRSNGAGGPPPGAGPPAAEGPPGNGVGPPGLMQ